MNRAFAPLSDSSSLRPAPAPRHESILLPAMPPSDASVPVSRLPAVSLQSMNPPGGRLRGAALARGIQAALLGMGLAALAACSTPGSSSGGGGADYSTNSSISGAASVSSPASERVLDGVVDLALTDRVTGSFDEARAHPVGTVKDGQSLYLYLRSTRPLGEIAHPADPYGKNSFSGYPHLFVQVGDNQSLRIINTCYVTLTPAEAKATELIVPLAPLSNRVGDLPTDCWLETVTHLEPVRQTLEVRLAGFPGKFESWLPVPDLLGVAAVDTDLSGGSAAWGRMLRAKPVESPALPAAGRAAKTTAAAGAAAAGTAGAAAAARKTDEVRRAEEARKAEEARRAEAARKAEEARRAEEARKAEEARRAGEARRVEEARKTDEARQAEALKAAQAAQAERAARAAEEARQAEAAQKAARAKAQNPITRNEIFPLNRTGSAAAQGAAAVAGGAATVAAGAASGAGGAGSAATAQPVAPVNSRAATAASTAAAVKGARESAAQQPLKPINTLPAGARLAAVTPLRPAVRQAVGTQRMAHQLQSLTSTLLGREPSETYFIDRRWQTQREPGAPRSTARQTIHAVAVFRGEECSWQSLLVTRRPGSGTLTEVVAEGDEVRIPCPDLKAAP